MRSVDRLLARFGGAVAAVGLATSPVLATEGPRSEPDMAPRTTEYCAPLVRTSTGRELNAGTTAHAFSQEHVGSVGISIYAGRDLGDNSPEFLGALLVNELRSRGVQAECFVHHERVPNGTGVRFHVAGLSMSEESIGITASFDENMLNGVAAEARTAGMLLVAEAGQAPGTNR